MTRNAFRLALVCVVFLATFVVACHLDLGNSPEAWAERRVRTADQMFYNYYVPPCGDPPTGAQLYVCPLPTPPLVGHTWITYEPFLPHEFLWHHHRTYKREQPDGKKTTTHVTWR
jgi:hypothetical protein